MPYWASTVARTLPGSLKGRLPMASSAPPKSQHQRVHYGATFPLTPTTEDAPWPLSGWSIH